MIRRNFITAFLVNLFGGAVVAQQLSEKYFSIVVNSEDKQVTFSQPKIISTMSVPAQHIVDRRREVLDKILEFFGVDIKKKGLDISNKKYQISINLVEMP